MSEPNTENEPTMEEILASIRKIISEDEPEEGVSGDSEAETAAPEAEEGASEDSEDDDGAEAAADEAADEADDDSDEPLELTQMVGEDGNVVDLKAHQEETAAAEAEDEPEVTLEPEAEEDDEAEPAVEEDSEIELEADSEEPAEDLEQEEEEAEDVEEDDDDDIPLPSPSEEVEEGLVSAMTATLATDTISQLSDVLTAESVPVGGSSAADKTLEALVRETISPHLKAWLDANLSDLVERIVRDEIKKMVKRAEYR